MRAKRAFYNITTEALQEIVALVCSLILPRMILSTFGSSYNGAVSSITQFLDYISLLALGFSGAVRVAIYKAKDDITAKSAIIKAAEQYMRKVSYAFIAYVTIMMFVFPLLVRDEFEWLEIASLVVIIGFGVFAEYCFGVTVRAFLSAEQRNYVWNIIQIFSRIMSTLISIALIRLGQSIQVVKFGSAIILVATPITANYITKRKFHLNANVQADTTALSMRKDVVAHSIANCIHSYTDVFLLTLFTNPATVSIYSVYTLVFNSIKKIQAVFTSGLEGAFGLLWARGEYKKYRENFNTYEFLCFSFVSVIFPCVGFLLIPFIRLFTKDVHDVNYILTAFAFLSVITNAVYGLRTPYVTVVQSAGHYKETKKYAFIEAGLNFSISFIAVFWDGLIGVTIGTLIANLYRTIQYAVYASKHLLGRSFMEFVKKILWLCANVFIIVMAKRMLPDVSISSWSLWIINGFYCVFISMIVTLISSFLFFRDELQRSIQLIIKMVGRK